MNTKQRSRPTLIKRNPWMKIRTRSLKLSATVALSLLTAAAGFAQDLRPSPASTTQPLSAPTSTQPSTQPSAQPSTQPESQKRTN